MYCGTTNGTIVSYDIVGMMPSLIEEFALNDNNS